MTIPDPSEPIPPVPVLDVPAGDLQIDDVILEATFYDDWFLHAAVVRIEQVAVQE